MKLRKNYVLGDGSVKSPPEIRDDQYVQSITSAIAVKLTSVDQVCRLDFTVLQSEPPQAMFYGWDVSWDTKNQFTIVTENPFVVRTGNASSTTKVVEPGRYRCVLYRRVMDAARLASIRVPRGVLPAEQHFLVVWKDVERESS